MTAQFMQELMVWFKDQKLLHKKYAFKVRVPDSSPSFGVFVLRFRNRLLFESVLR